ncbi:hypothetical protein YSA_09844 [Pseudomonas putida ND6]|uniref:Uncharacterized protein n=1 Tax=Pseudomonas putida ND6 TaxID=231023 RepID=I3V2Z4_PSEPU|nr:hypothetical protein YSA_09844 [Pseudomonas putida ND6]
MQRCCLLNTMLSWQKPVSPLSTRGLADWHGVCFVALESTELQGAT